MSKLIAIDNFKTGNWSLTVKDLASHYADLFIGFTNEAPVVEFTNLKFGFELRQDDNIKQYGVFPPAGVKYIRTDQDYVEVVRLKFKPDQTYTLWLWCENNAQRFEHEFQLETPVPDQPYDSWTWDGEQWNSPVPYPEGTGVYWWDEESGQWVEDTE